MVENNISFDDVVDFWMTFFPEIEQKYDFEELLEKTSKSTIDELENIYFIDNEIKLDDMFNVLDSETYICSPLEDFFNDLQKIHKWAYFFRPVIGYFGYDIYKYLEGVEIIQDKNAFFKEIISALINALFPMAYKVLALETNIARMDGKLEGETSVEKAQYFSEVLLKDNKFVKELYEEYFELTRLMKLKVKNLSDFIVEIINNTEKQYDQLEVKFGNRGKLGALTEMVMGAGDSHNNGKSVVKLLFSSGIKLVYKPRTLEIETGYYELIDWLNSQTVNSFIRLKAPNIHNIKGAGWMEFIEQKECSNPDEIKRFYYRTGQILCLLYILNAKDFHYENLIACADQPVLIDLETLFHPEIIGFDLDNSNSTLCGAHYIYNSVKGAALLPTQIVNQKNNRIMEVGGLSNTDRQAAPFKSYYLKDFNSAEIKVVSEYGFVEAKNNNPILDGMAVDSAQYTKEIKNGFFFTYKWIEENRSIFKEKLMLLFKECLGRLVYRPTNVYMQLLTTSYHPDVLRNTIDRKIYLNRIGLVADTGEREILNSELAQMLDGDIPYFLAYFEGDSILDCNGRIIMSLPGCSAFRSIERKLDKLDARDLSLQLSIINFSYSNNIEVNGICATNMTFYDSEYKNGINCDKFIETAKQIGDYVLSTSIAGNADGKIDRTWIGLIEIKKDFKEISCVGNDIYTGNSGIALFLAYLGVITENEKYKKAALEAVTAVINSINDITDFKTVKLGFFSGVSGWLYSIFSIGKILNDKELVNFVYKKISVIGQMLASDQNCDIISGISGAMGAIISIYEHTDDVDIKKYIIGICNEQFKLIKQKVVVLEDGESITWGEEGFVGFSHGNAGVISQLIRLYGITKEPDIIKTIKSALKYENTMFNGKCGNWDKQLNSNIFLNKWCHGAPGVLLSNLILYKNNFFDEDIKSKIALSLKTVKKKGFGENYCLCHGDLGNLLILNYASQILKDEVLRTNCIKTAENFIDQYFNKRWEDDEFKQTQNMGLMAGISGIGYGLLQLYRPELCPNILCLE